MRPPINPLPGDYKPPAPADETADVLARVYALILSWPTVEERQEAQQEGSNGR